MCEDLFIITHNVGHMSSGGFRSESLSTEAETTIEVLSLATHKPRHYLYAMLANVNFIALFKTSKSDIY